MHTCIDPEHARYCPEVPHAIVSVSMVYCPHQRDWIVRFYTQADTSTEEAHTSHEESWGPLSVVPDMVDAIRAELEHQADLVETWFS